MPPPCLTCFRRRGTSMWFHPLHRGFVEGRLRRRDDISRVPRWQPRHQSSPAPPSAFRRCLPVGHVHLQARLCSFLFGSLVWDVLPSALRPSFGSSPVLCCVFVSRWHPRHRQGRVPLFLPLPSSRLSPALQLPAVLLCWCFPREWGNSSSGYRLGHHCKHDVAPATIVPGGCRMKHAKGLFKRPIRSHWCVASGWLLAAGWSMPSQRFKGFKVFKGLEGLRVWRVLRVKGLANGRLGRP